jgi:prephenate dehydrogenase
MKPTAELHDHLVAAIGHLQAAVAAAGVHDADVPVPEDVDAAVFADPTFKAARTRFGQAIERLAADAPTPEVRQVVLNAEEAAHATIAAAIDVAWRLGRSARPGATS